MATSLNPPSVSFCSKFPHRMLVLRIEYTHGALPNALLDALELAGWRWDALESEPPIGTDRVHMFASRPGSGLFGSWTDEERGQFLPEVYAVLKKFGYDEHAVPVSELHFRDMV